MESISIKSQSGFRHSIENFRGLAIVFVLLTHVYGYDTLGALGNFLHFLVADATTWFVFVSGYLFWHIECRSKFTPMVYWWKKLKFVLLPYLIMSIPAVLVGIFLKRPELYGLSNEAYVAWSLLVGRDIVAPLWFIPMIALFFACAPIFNRLGRSARFPLVVVVALLFSLFSGRPFSDSNPFLSFTHFLGFYLLGMYASQQWHVVTRWSEQFGMVAMTLGVAVFAYSAIQYRPVDTMPLYVESLWKLNSMQLGKLGLLVSVVVFMERYASAPNVVLGKLAKLSFGLFFVHGFYSAIFPRLMIWIGIDSSMLRLLIEILMVVGVLVLTTIAIKSLTRGWSRYVIGC